MTFSLCQFVNIGFRGLTSLTSYNLVASCLLTVHAFMFSAILLDIKILSFCFPMSFSFRSKNVVFINIYLPTPNSKLYYHHLFPFVDIFQYHRLLLVFSGICCQNWLCIKVSMCQPNFEGIYLCLVSYFSLNNPFAYSSSLSLICGTLKPLTKSQISRIMDVMYLGQFCQFLHCQFCYSSFISVILFYFALIQKYVITHLISLTIRYKHLLLFKNEPCLVLDYWMIYCALPYTHHINLCQMLNWVCL